MHNEMCLVLGPLHRMQILVILDKTLGLCFLICKVETIMPT
jgi:hypothetical protein